VLYRPFLDVQLVKVYESSVTLRVDLLIFRGIK